jgi:hypothetical protein
VTPRGKESSPLLVAHVVFSPGMTETGQIAVLQRIASKWPLPRDMYPSIMLSVPSLPLAPSAKLDRQAIGALPISNGLQNATMAAQLSNTEERLRLVWEEVLAASSEDGAIPGSNPVSRDSDFFHVGGSSMLVIKLQALIKRRFGASYILTAVTGRLAGGDEFGEVSLTAHQPPSECQDGYIASKWASEVFLEVASAALGLPVWIHRPSGQGVNETDVMNSVIKHARLLKAVPVSDRWTGQLDSISVEQTTKSILKLVEKETVNRSTPREISVSNGARTIFTMLGG